MRSCSSLLSKCCGGPAASRIPLFRCATRRFKPQRAGDAKPEQAQPAVLISAEDVEAALLRAHNQPNPAAQWSAAEPGKRKRAPRGTGPAAIRSKALRSSALQCTGLTEGELSARIKALRKVVPGLKEETVLQQPPHVVAELCGEAGAATAAARLVEMQCQHPEYGPQVLDTVLRCPDLLTASARRSILWGHARGVNQVAFAQQGTTLVSVDNDGCLKVWDLRELRSCTDVPPARQLDRLCSVAAHPDGRHVLVGGSRPAYLGAAARQSLRHSLLCVLDLETKQWVGEATNATPRLYDAEIRTIAVVPGKYSGLHHVMSASRLQGVNVWEVSVGAGGAPGVTVQEVASTLSTHAAYSADLVRAVAAAPGAHAVLTVGSSIMRWTWGDPRAQAQPAVTVVEPKRTILHMDVAVCPEGKLAVTLSCSSGLKVYDLQSNKRVATLEGSRRSTCAAISPDGRHAVAGDGKGMLSAWDLATFTRVLNVKVAHGKGVSCLAFSPDGRQLVTGAGDGLLRLWEWDQLLQQQ